MRIRDIAGANNEHVCILGFGREGKATLRILENISPHPAIHIADADPAVRHPDYPLITGPEYLETVDRQRFWKIIKSPGILPQPIFDQWRREGRLITATQIFFASIQETGATVIGVTGSKGKSTTASLIFAILKKAGKDAHLIGNIGKPAIEYIETAKPGTLFVMELSSYQLMDLTVSPAIAVITSFFPEHLDYHGSLENYLEAKKHIARFQSKDDAVFFNTPMPKAKEIADESAGEKIGFSVADAPVAIEETKLLGRHNLSNIAAAWKVVSRLGITKETAIAAIKAFQGLPHRLQSLGIHRGIEWVDDAISTTPESAIAALDAIGDRVGTIILGGQDRGGDFGALAKRIVDSTIEHVILIGETGPRIADALKRIGSRAKQHAARDMAEIVSIATRTTPRGRTCLLSTASPSYDMFKNFEEKGDEFRRRIERTRV